MLLVAELGGLLLEIVEMRLERPCIGQPRGGCYRAELLRSARPALFGNDGSLRLGLFNILRNDRLLVKTAAVKLCGLLPLCALLVDTVGLYLPAGLVCSYRRERIHRLDVPVIEHILHNGRRECPVEILLVELFRSRGNCRTEVGTIAHLTLLLGLLLSARFTRTAGGIIPRRVGYLVIGIVAVGVLIVKCERLLLLRDVFRHIQPYRHLQLGLGRLLRLALIAAFAGAVKQSRALQRKAVFLSLVEHLAAVLYRREHFIIVRLGERGLLQQLHKALLRKVRVLLDLAVNAVADAGVADKAQKLAALHLLRRHYGNERFRVERLVRGARRLVRRFGSGGVVALHGLLRHLVILFFPVVVIVGRIRREYLLVVRDGRWGIWELYGVGGLGGSFFGKLRLKAVFFGLRSVLKRRSLRKSRLINGLPRGPRRRDNGFRDRLLRRLRDRRLQVGSLLNGHIHELGSLHDRGLHYLGCLHHRYLRYHRGALEPCHGLVKAPIAVFQRIGRLEGHGARHILLIF